MKIIVSLLQFLSLKSIAALNIMSHICKAIAVSNNSIFLGNSYALFVCLLRKLCELIDCKCYNCCDLVALSEYQKVTGTWP